MKSHPKRFNIRRFFHSFTCQFWVFGAMELIFGYVRDIGFSLAQKKSWIDSSNFDLLSDSKHTTVSQFWEKVSYHNMILTIFQLWSRNTTENDNNK